MKTNSIRMTLAAATFVWVGSLQAQYTVDWFTLAGGGGTVGGGKYTLSGTVGQSVAGHLSGGNYAMEGGFWSGVIFSPNLFITRAGAEVALSWQGRDFMLQSAPDISGPWTDLSPGVSTDGVHFETRSPIGGQRTFFRLRAGP